MVLNHILKFVCSVFYFLNFFGSLGIIWGFSWGDNFRTVNGFSFHRVRLYTPLIKNVKHVTVTKKTLFYGRTDLPSRVGRSVGRLLLLLLFFPPFISGSKMTLKHENFEKKSDLFCKKKKKKGGIFWLIFKHFQLKFSDFGQKTADLTRFWNN